MYRLLVTGQNGQIGQSIKHRIKDQDWEVLLTDIDTLDITNSEQVKRVFKTFRPHVVINAAGYTEVDRAESEAAIAASVNAHGPYLLAMQCHDAGAFLIHFSTDYIFSGDSLDSYVETDKPEPNNVYGRSKLQGEQYIKTYLDQYVIIRTSWVFSEYARNFVTTMLSLYRDKERVRVVNDQFGCPTYAGDLADLVLEIAKDYKAEAKRYQFGVYHFCGNSSVSWFDFAGVIFDIAEQYQTDGPRQHLTEVTSSEYAAAAKRPTNGILNCYKISPLFKLSDWRKRLHQVIEKSMNSNY